MSKNSKPPKTVAHKVLDEMHKFQVSVSQKLSEVVEKHNELAAKIAGLEAVCKNVMQFSASEIGKLQAHQQLVNQEIGISMSRMDMNVLALAEMTKDIFIKMQESEAQILNLRDALIDNPEDNFAAILNCMNLDDERYEQVKSCALSLRDAYMKAAFKKVQDEIEAEDKKRSEDIEKAQKEAESKAEADTVEKELQRADALDKGISLSVAGPGSSFPEGAEIFGG